MGIPLLNHFGAPPAPLMHFPPSILTWEDNCLWEFPLWPLGPAGPSLHLSPLLHIVIVI